MKTIHTLIIITGLLSGTALAERINFDDAKTGAPPPGWTATQTGSGSAKWSVEKDNYAPSKPNVLKQSGEDQAGGVIWRARDANNYYIFRANANENNAVLYKTVNGKRSPLDIVGRKGGYGVKETVASGQWHTLRVDFAGNRFKAYYDGKHLFDVEDTTFTEAGKVGVWTKADSVTLFDDFTYGSK